MKSIIEAINKGVLSALSTDISDSDIDFNHDDINNDAHIIPDNTNGNGYICSENEKNKILEAIDKVIDQVETEVVEDYTKQKGHYKHNDYDAKLFANIPYIPITLDDISGEFACSIYFLADLEADGYNDEVYGYSIVRYKIIEFDDMCFYVNNINKEINLYINDDYYEECLKLQAEYNAKYQAVTK